MAIGETESGNEAPAEKERPAVIIWAGAGSIL
jgi:hypothetical protein